MLKNANTYSWTRLQSKVASLVRQADTIRQLLARSSLVFPLSGLVANMVAGNLLLTSLETLRLILRRAI